MQCLVRAMASEHTTLQSTANVAQLTADGKSLIVPLAALEPLLNALCSLEEDSERGASSSGMGIDAAAYGRNWALYRARSRLNYNDLVNIKKCIWPAVRRSTATRFGGKL